MVNTCGQIAHIGIDLTNGEGTSVPVLVVITRLGIVLSVVAIIGLLVLSTYVGLPTCEGAVVEVGGDASQRKCLNRRSNGGSSQFRLENGNVEFLLLLIKRSSRTGSVAIDCLSGSQHSSIHPTRRFCLSNGLAQCHSRKVRFHRLCISGILGRSNKIPRELEIRSYITIHVLRVANVNARVTLRNDSTQISPRHRGGSVILVLR